MNQEKNFIQTENAPKAIGSYSQAVRVGNTVWISGQIPLDPKSMILVGDNSEDGFNKQTHQVFKNLKNIAEAAGGSLENIVKLNIFLTDLKFFPNVNEIMQQYFDEPYPARAAVGVKSLPKDSAIEAEAILIINNN